MILVVWIQCWSLTERMGIFLTSVIFEADLPAGLIFILTKCFFKLGHRIRHWTKIKTANICKHEFSLFWFSMCQHRRRWTNIESTYRIYVLRQLGFVTTISVWSSLSFYLLYHVNHLNFNVKIADIYNQIHINQDYWISQISQSILNQFSQWNFARTIFHSCRDYPENFAK